MPGMRLVAKGKGHIGTFLCVLFIFTSFLKTPPCRPLPIASSESISLPLTETLVWQEGGGGSFWMQTGPLWLTPGQNHVYNSIIAVTCYRVTDCFPLACPQLLLPSAPRGGQSLPHTPHSTDDEAKIRLSDLFEIKQPALVSVAQWLGAVPGTEEAAGWVPSQGTCSGNRLGPW